MNYEKVNNVSVPLIFRKSIPAGEKGYIDILASDCHSPALRPPNLSEAYKKLKKESDRLIENSLKIINDKLI